eukprot:19651-Heterocapsa_arctica.AAC.1
MSSYVTSTCSTMKIHSMACESGHRPTKKNGRVRRLVNLHHQSCEHRTYPSDRTSCRLPGRRAAEVAAAMAAEEAHRLCRRRNW